MLKILPLGGLGEIGMNAMLVAYGDDALLIDCGVLFPDPELHGVDLVIPDFSLIRSLGVKVHAYVLTHGHEDHIGALPYALPMIDAPIYASRFTAGLVQSKLGEWGLDYVLELVRPREKRSFGPFEVEFLSVTHSIPDGLALAITTPHGVVIHSGDFKIDHRPIDGQQTDLARFAEYGDRGVLALLSDSTNADREGVSTSESVIGRELAQAMAGCEGRVFIASFASHIHRMQQVIDISRELGRKVVLNGRSMVNNARIARDLKVLHAPDDVFVPVDKAKDCDPRSLTILTTGSQAEPSSAMSKLAHGESQHLSIAPGDLVIFSSRSIPGNERAISRVMNGLVRQGARVISSQIARVHTSGHAHREEQRLLINLVKPRFFVPIHGEMHHLASHAEIAGQCGITRDRIFVIEDGQSLVLEADEGAEPASSEGEGPDISAYLGERYQPRRIFVDGKGVGDISDIVVRDRQALATAGICVCIVIIDPGSGDVVQGPDLFIRGISGSEDSRLLDEATSWVKKGINEHTADARRDRAVMEEAVRVSLRRFFRRELDRKPVILPFVLSV